MNPIFQAALKLDANLICKMAYGQGALSAEAKQLRALQERIQAGGENYGDQIPMLVRSQQFFQSFGDAVNHLSQLREHDHKSQGYDERARNLISQLTSQSGEVFLWADLLTVKVSYDEILKTQNSIKVMRNELKKALHSHATQSTDALTSLHQGFVEDLMKSKEEGLGSFSKMVEEGNTLLREIKEEAQQIKVASLESGFQADVSNHQKIARYWLIATLGLSGSLSLGALAMVCLADLRKLGFAIGQNPMQSALLFAFYLVPILVILGMINLSAKRLSAHSHLVAVLEHKASIARAFLWMGKAEPDSALRSEWMRAIVDGLVRFESSGFLGKEAGSSPQPISMQVISEAAKLAGGGTTENK